MNLYLDRSRHEGDEAAHHLQGFRHQVPVARQRRDRLRAGGTDLAVRSGERTGGGSADHDQGRLRFAGAAASGGCRQAYAIASAPPGRQARRSRWRAANCFRCPAKDGTARNLTRTSNAHERDAVWSPDGKWIAYNSDITGENELYVRPQDGKGEPNRSQAARTPITTGRSGRPTSKKLLWADRAAAAALVDVQAKAVTLVDQDKCGEIRAYDWSPEANGSPLAGRKRTGSRGFISSR